MEKGLRFDQDKLRYDLIHPLAIEGLVKVLTAGSKKYAPRNWEKGMEWSKVIASLKRHLTAIEKGEDFDSETGLLHVDHLQCNAHFLSAYYHIYPQGDNRPHSYLNYPKIGLDIDEVLAAWTPAWCKKWKIKMPEFWYFDKDIKMRFEQMKSNNELDRFYLSLKVLTRPQDIPFEPHCYITSRPVSSDITQQWLDVNCYAHRPIYTVPLGESKVETIIKSGCEIFVDDRFDNFVQINKAGICCYLFDAPHNRRYNVGHKRIKSLNEILK